MKIFDYINSSLQRKLVFAAVVVEVFMLSLLVWNSVRISETHLIEQTQNRINELLPLVNASISVPLMEYDIESLQELLEQIVRNQGVRFIELNSNNDSHIIHYGKEIQADLMLVLNSTYIDLSKHEIGNNLEITVPVTIASLSVGNMRIQFDSSYIVQAVSDLREQATVIAIVEVILSIVLLSILGLGLTRHLKVLTTASKALAAGDLDARVKLQGNDEITQLASTLNTVALTRHRVESALKSLAIGSLGDRTETSSFFDNAVLTLSEAFDASYAFIGLIDPDKTDHVNTISLSVDGQIAPNFGYALEYTPCETVVKHAKQLIPKDVCIAYPKDDLAIDMGLESYFGSLLSDHNGHKFGVIVVCHTQPIEIAPWMELLLDVFAARVSLELESQASAKILEQSEHYNRMLFEESTTGLALCRMDGSLVDVNSAYCNILGREPDEIKSLTYWEITPEKYADQEQEQIELLESTDHYGPYEKEYIHKDGRLIPVRLTGRIIELNDERFIWSSVQDITEHKEAEKTIRRMAYHDSLTGLINRHEFEDRLNRALKSAHKRNIDHALLFLDLDQFKIINDTCGHGAGDELLRQLSQLIQNNMRERDSVARLGGDEFGILLEHCSLEQAEEIADKLIPLICNYRFAWQDRTFAVGASIGIAPLTADTQKIEPVLRAADMACYTAKDLGRNRTHVFHPDDKDLAERVEQIHWVTDIREAIDQDRFVMFRQSINSLSGNDIHAYEYLIRLRRPDGELILPGTFIPAAERYNLMPAIDRWVINAVFKHLQNNPLSVAATECDTFINLSGTSLNDKTLSDYVQSQLALYDVDARRICFEVTETAAVANLSHATGFVESIRALGCFFALDDFGSGISSFSYLKALPVNYIKIDGGFVKNMLNDPMDSAIVHVIHEIGDAAGIKTIAEFVEDSDVMDKLCEMGIDFAQGYYIDKPKALSNSVEKQQLAM